MAKNINVNIRMDEQLKKAADELFAELGLNMTTAINMFTRQAVRQQKIPFEVSLLQPNAETLEAINDVRKQKNLSKSFSSVDELMKGLENED